jgi:hypothetical protein
MIAGWRGFAEVFVFYLVLGESSRVCYSYKMLIITDPVYDVTIPLPAIQA